MAELGTAGRALADVSSPDEFLGREKALGLDRTFDALEALLSGRLELSAAGHPVADFHFGDRGGYGSVSLVERRPDDVAVIQEHYQLQTQQGRGAWFLPEEATLAIGVTNTASLAAKTTRFFWNGVRDASVKVDLRQPSDALFLWAALIPLFEQLYRPLALRADTGKLKDAETQISAWADAESLYRSLGLRVDGAFAAMRFGGAWGQLSLDEQLLCRRQLLNELADQPAREIARRWRAGATQRLTSAFYEKSKRGTPLASKVLKRPLHRDFAAIFGGDWLALLRYLGEPPNPAEKITTALPETRLYVPEVGQAAAVAAESGVPVEDVEQILAAYLGQARVVSPVRERVDVLNRWWPIFDEIHARQTPAMENLWGFVDDGHVDPIPTPRLDVRGDPGKFRRDLPAGLAEEIERLWDGITIAKYPDRIVSEFHPHRQMAETLGPAAPFWHGVALTCWFVCEGPSSRTDLAGIEHYYRRPLEELDNAGYPIDRGLFAELIAAELRLGPPQDTGGYETRHDGPHGTTIRTTAGGYKRRDGFEYLRDIITRHRRAWAERFDEYLNDRWQSELRLVGREFNRRFAANGKPPTLKQFAPVAAPAANHWFGGDLSALFAALGEPSATPDRIDLLAGDPIVFVEALFVRLGGLRPDPGRLIDDIDLRARELTYSRLASDALKYLQLWEATGEAPTVDSFNKTSYDWSHLGGEQQGWRAYVNAINELRVQPDTRRDAELKATDQPTPAPDPATQLPDAQWAKDPLGHYEYRYWDGAAWTDHVATGGQQATDPLL